jgi:hypothetical protein
MRCTNLLAFLICFSAQIPAQNTPESERLLNPKALAGQTRERSAEGLRRNFADPPAEYRSMPLWVWNDWMEYPRLAEMLGQYKANGMGGAFVHPRPGLMTEYLGEDWFKLWKQSAAEGKRLGLYVNIYDENSYPSGFAGGNVPSIAPETASQYVSVDIDSAPKSVPLRRADIVATFAVERNAVGAVTAMQRVTTLQQIPAGQALATFHLRRASGNPWTAEFPYVDLTNPQTTPAFLETTHEQYKKRMGAEFGKTIRWAFTDEPLLATAGAYDSAKLALPLSYNTLAEFHRRNGYDLADQIPSLYWDVGDYRKVRFDYWQTLHDLWKENFMRPMFEWCDRNNIQFTGHWMEHEWPYPWITPADANLYAFEHAPGIDMLEGTNIRLTGQDPHMLFTIKQVASVSHQLGRRAFCEAYGVSGWDSTFEHYKRFGDWLMVHGIDFIDQHLSYVTVRGARKRDHPQSFSDVSPWWPYYKLHGDHLGRVSYLLAQGEVRNRTVILEQTTSGFLVARRDGATPELAEMRTHNADMNQFLADRHVDYDLADEYMVEWFGGVEGKQFRVGKMKYDVLILPPDLTNLRHQTLPVLEQYLAAGGQILALSTVPAYVDGRASDAPAQLQARFAAQWKQVSGLPELAESVNSRIRFEPATPAGIGVAERFLDNGDRLVFLANTGLTEYRGSMDAGGAAAELWDTVTGETRPVGLPIAVDLPAAGSAMYLIKAQGTPVQAAPEKQFARIDAGWKIAPAAPNVLSLDYCDLTLAGETSANINTWQANWDIWQRHGFERPAWDNAVQFRQSVFDRNHFDAASGFDAVFHFEVAESAAARELELAVESPELYAISVNGHPLEASKGTRWLDPHIMRYAIERFAHVGTNEIRISAHPFDVKMELENIYLRGRFSLEPGEKGFRLVAEKPLAFGSWAKQGMPFFADSVIYTADVNASGKLRVRLDEFNASVVEVLVDGKRAAVLGWQPWSAEADVQPGRHEVTVKVVSTPRNLFGPFHNPAKLRMRAWPAAWAEFPEHQPAGAAYDVLDYGLFKPPVVEVAK